MKTLLFVCTGNTCRSPMAKGLAASWLKNRGVSEVAVESAGLAAVEGVHASENAILALSEYDINLKGHRARSLTPTHLERATLVVTMTAGMREALLLRYPQYAGKIVTLLPDRDVLDPYGGSLDEYRQVRDQLADALPELLDRFLAMDT